ncbi:hypothetical protein ACFWBG_18870 [Nocardia salmonicida]|uniref:hypothetical protein n=1 Tax=Nocardia salmonicida TaxID=53431 RepID=UPI00366C0A0B
MKRVLASAGIAAAIMMSGTAMASADVVTAPVAGPATGSSDGALIDALLRQIGSGSSQPCDGIMLDTCIPVGATSAPQALPVADSGSASESAQALDIQIWELIGWLSNGSSDPQPCGSFPITCL